MKHERESKSDWHPLRSPGLGKPTKSSFESVAWTPSQIPHGSELQIHVQRLQRSMKHLALDLPIALSNYTEARDEGKPNITGTPNQEAITAERATTPTKKRKSGSVERTVSTIDVKLNFEGIYQQVEQVLRNGARNPDFETRYGEEIDRALKERFLSIILKNLLYLLSEDDDDGALLDQTFFTLVLSFVLTASFPLTIASQSKISEAIPIALIADMLCSWAMYILMATLYTILLPILDKERYVKRMQSKKKTSKEIVLRHIIPTKVIRHALYPAIYSVVVPKKPIIRGKKK